MMVSTKGRYALRVMLDLAMQKQEEYVSLNDIAQRQKISMKYLESIVGMLNKAGLLQSRRGKDGGYRMARRLHGRGRLRPGVRASGELPDQTDVESTGRNYRRISFQRIDPGSAGWEVLTLRWKWKG